MVETLQTQTDRRKIVHEKNAQRTDIDETMGEGGGDEEEDGESEDDNEDGQGTGVADKQSGTKRRKQISFYFTTGTSLVRTTSDNGREKSHPHIFNVRTWTSHSKTFHPHHARQSCPFCLCHPLPYSFFHHSYPFLHVFLGIEKQFPDKQKSSQICIV